MHTITIVVGDAQGDRGYPVQIIPTEGLDTREKLAVLRAAEDQLIAALVQEAERRGRAAGKTKPEQEETGGEKEL